MKIADVLHKDSVDVGINVRNKSELLDKMLELAVKSGKIKDFNESRKEILEREKIMSTGVGNGIALPHAKTNGVEDSVGALGIMENPVDFESLDGEPVNIVFLLLGMENNVGTHLRLLSKISRLMNNDSFRIKLLECKNPDEILSTINEYEENHK